MRIVGQPVSAIIPTYNRAQLIGRAIRSALAAIRPGDEVIVVDDGSRDDTEEAIRPYRYLVRYIRTEHRGAGAARNRGVTEARNPLVTFLDSDDEWLPWILDLSRAVLDARPDVLFCFSDFRSDHNGRIYTRALRHWHDDPRGWDEIIGPAVPYSTLADLPEGWSDFDCHIGSIYAVQINMAFVCTITTTVRRAESGAALHFPEDLPTYEDWSCFSTLAKHGLGAFLDCETAVQHCHPGSRLTDADTLACATARLSMLRRIWGADPGFLALNADLYLRTFKDQQLRRIRGLIKHGRVREARAELAALAEAPGWYHALAALPGPLLRRFFELRRRLQTQPS